MNCKKRFEKLRGEGKTEFRSGEDLEAWIKRMVSYFPDPWAGVKRLNREVRERHLQEWVDAHRFRVGDKGRGGE